MTLKFSLGNCMDDSVLWKIENKYIPIIRLLWKYVVLSVISDSD